MENQLAENIRNYRKSLGLTQEQLAERLGITLGAVSKWERGGSEPDLGYIMDLAELFHVSVDALIGFSMRGSNADEEADRIEGLVNRVSFRELEEEYDRALKKFPNHFRTVLGAASVYKRSGTMNQNETHLRRALELFRHALELISQNRDPEVNEVVLRNEIAGCYTGLKEYRKAVEEYRKNNLGGISNANIGLLLIWDEKKPEEGIEYTEKAFLSHISETATVMYSYVLYYLVSGKPERGLRASEWFADFLRRTKEDPKRRSFLDKIISLCYLLQGVLRDSLGQTERAEEDLDRALRLARSFDDAPVYTLENICFTEHAPDTVYFYDDAGPTALEGLRGMLEEAGDLVPADFRRKAMKAIGGCR